jgi:hypothetical protein
MLVFLFFYLLLPIYLYLCLLPFLFSEQIIIKEERKHTCNSLAQDFLYLKIKII